MQKWTCFVLMTISVSLVGPANLIAGEIDELQGKWEFRFQENGRQLRAIKTIKGDTDTTETFDGDRLVHRHISKIEFVETEDLIIMKWGESETTDGPRKGTKGKPGSCLSKRLGNKWYHVHGLKAGEKYPPSLQEFTRVDATN